MIDWACAVVAFATLDAAHDEEASNTLAARILSLVPITATIPPVLLSSCAPLSLSGHANVANFAKPLLNSEPVV